MSQAKLKVVNNENSMDKENRSKSLEAAVSLIEKNYGKGSIMKLGSKTNVDIEAIERNKKIRKLTHELNLNNIFVNSQNR